MLLSLSEAVVVDSVVYEPSKEEMPVSEGLGLDNHIDSGPETPSPGLVDSLNVPGVENLAGAGHVEPSPMLPHSSDPPVPVNVVLPGSDPPVPEFRLLLGLPDLSSDGAGPVESSPVLPHISDPPVPVNMVVPGSDPPIPEFRLLLELPGLSSDSASAVEDFFPEPGSLSAWPGFVETFRLKLGGSPPAPGGPEWAPPEPGGFMRSEKKLCTGYGILRRHLGTCCFG